MKKKIVGAILALAAIGVVAGIAVALWMAQGHIASTVHMGAKPAAAIVFAATDDDEVVASVNFDPLDAGVDPSSTGPMPTRYTRDTGHSSLIQNSTETATLTIDGGYGGYWTTSLFTLRNNGTPWTLTAVKVGTVSLVECPTMTSIDADTSGEPDVEICFIGAATETVLPFTIINTVWAANGEKNVLMPLHILDTATPDATLTFDVAFTGNPQP